MTEDTTFEMSVTRPDEQGIVVERIVSLSVTARPDTQLVVSIDDAVVVSRPLTSTSAVPASRSLNALPSVPPWLANQEPYTVRGR